MPQDELLLAIVNAVLNTVQAIALAYIGVKYGRSQNGRN